MLDFAGDDRGSRHDAGRVARHVGAASRRSGLRPGDGVAVVLPNEVRFLELDLATMQAVLLGQPGVADAAVIGVPDEEWGEQVKAVVQAKDPDQRSDELAGS